MIYDLAQEVKRQLAARLFPHPVLYGPERAQREGFDMAIVFERDRAAGDQIVAPAGAKAPPTQIEAPYNRRVAGTVRIFARSPRPGARAADHEVECDRVADGVLCALYRACKAARLPIEITESRLLEADDFNKLETWPGTVCQIRFLVTTLVRDVNYIGVGPLTGDVFDVHAPIVTEGELPDFNPVDPD